jgi:hypothetical protein
MKMLRAVLPALVVAASVASAQSAPPITKAKQSAQRAVAATNAHTAAMTNVPTAEPKAKTDSATQTPPAKSDTGVSRVTAKDSAAGTTAVTKASERPAFEREVFVYSREGRRDPFTSLMTSSDLRPLLSDLKLTGIAFDPTGKNSVAVLRDIGSKEQYRVRVGQSLGRMRVASIGTKSITFTIEEFGYSRQESLALVDSKKERTQ